MYYQDDEIVVVGSGETEVIQNWFLMSLWRSSWNGIQESINIKKNGSVSEGNSSPQLLKPVFRTYLFFKQEVVMPKSIKKAEKLVS
jgi:hypothetical protein